MSFFADIGAGASSLGTKLGDTLSGITKFVGDNAEGVLSIAKQIDDLKQIGKPKKKAPDQAPAAPTVQPSSGMTLSPMLLAGGALVLLLVFSRK